MFFHRKLPCFFSFAHFTSLYNKFMRWPRRRVHFVINYYASTFDKVEYFSVIPLIYPLFDSRCVLMQMPKDSAICPHVIYSLDSCDTHIVLVHPVVLSSCYLQPTGLMSEVAKEVKCRCAEERRCVTWMTPVIRSRWMSHSWTAQILIRLVVVYMLANHVHVLHEFAHLGEKLRAWLNGEKTLRVKLEVCCCFDEFY